MKKFGILILILTFLMPGAGVMAEERESNEKLISALGLLNDYDDGTFRSDSYVMNDEFIAAVYKLTEKSMPENRDNALKMLIEEDFVRHDLPSQKAVEADDILYAMVRILGYKEENYQKSASDAGLLKGVVLKDAYITRRSFSKLVYQTLIADRMVLSTISGSKVTFEKKGNLLNDVFHIKKISGVVAADWSASLDGRPGKDLIKGEMLIGDVVVTTELNTKEYLGRRTEAFVAFEEKSDGRGALVTIEKVKNEEIKTTSEFIDGATTSKKLVWLDPEASQMRSKAIPPEAVVIYNGQWMGAAQGLEWSNFTPGDGEVNLIDNDRDGTVDVVLIWNYIPYLVDYVSVTNEIIYSKTNIAPIRLQDREYAIFDEDGTPVALTDLGPLDVLCAAYEVGGTDEVIILRSSKKPVSGVYMRDGFGLRIDADEYSFGAWCEVGDVVNGDFITAYLDIYSRAVYIAKQSKYAYGVLTKVSYDDVEENIYVKLYSFEEGIQNIRLAERVTVYEYEEPKVKYSKNKGDFPALYEGLSKRTGLVRYRKNTSSEINELVFNGVKDMEDIPSSATDGFYLYYTSKGRENMANYNANMFISRYRVTPNTKILSLEGDPLSPEGFIRLTTHDLVADYEYPVSIYDVSEKFEAKVILLDKIPDNYTKYGSIVEKVMTVADGDGMPLLAISIYTLGEHKTIFADNPNLITDKRVAEKFYNEKTFLSEITAGDVIYYTLNSEGRISSFAVLYKNKEQTYYHTSNYGWGDNYIPNAAMTVAYCEVKKTYSDLIIADIDGAKPIAERVGRNYYLFEKSKNRLTKISFRDIMPKDKIVCLWKWSNMNDLIVYR